MSCRLKVPKASRAGCAGVWFALGIVPGCECRLMWEAGAGARGLNVSCASLLLPVWCWPRWTRPAWSLSTSQEFGAYGSRGRAGIAVEVISWKGRGGVERRGASQRPSMHGPWACAKQRCGSQKQKPAGPTGPQPCAMRVLCKLETTAGLLERRGWFQLSATDQHPALVGLGGAGTAFARHGNLVHGEHRIGASVADLAV